MKNRCNNTFIFDTSILLLVYFLVGTVTACSTFKLQKGGELIYGHNLNQGDIGVPGLVFINKRGIYKLGRTWSEITTKERLNPSSHCWISRYGSVTFNVLGRDFPDGGMNEVGLYIWEMNEDGDYPKNDSLPILYELNWMQYILDNYSTVDEAVQCASEIEVEGPGKHFFVGDARGDCATVAFIDGDIVINRDRTMPVPGLFNTPYDRELELLRFYQGFGGLYDPDLSDPRIPRFVKTAVMIRDYISELDIVDYGFKMLDRLKVWDVPEWSILFDVRKRNVYFKTRLNPEIKSFSMNKIDFTNDTPVLILNMDIEKGGDVLSEFHPYTNKEMRDFTKRFVFPIAPEDLLTRGGITLEEYLQRTSTHSDAAALAEYQFFNDVWVYTPENTEKDELIELRFETKAEAVSGQISFLSDTEECYKLDHIHLIGDSMNFTFETNSRRNKFLQMRAIIDENRMNATMYSIENTLGNYLFLRDNRPM